MVATTGPNESNSRIPIDPQMAKYQTMKRIERKRDNEQENFI